MNKQTKHMFISAAAHCITDGKAQLKPKDKYIVAAGKYFLRYDHPEDANSTQFSSVGCYYVGKTVTHLFNF